jgi:hypothetical protein
MKKVLVLAMVLGLASMASATPIITPAAPTVGTAGGIVTMTLEGTAAEASVDGQAGSGGYQGAVWVDYTVYTSTQASITALGAWTANVGGSLSMLNTKGYLPLGFDFVAACDVPWTEAGDVDAGAWATFDVTVVAGLPVSTMIPVEVLDAGYGIVGTTYIEVVPEPMTMALLGLGGLGLLRRRR